MEIEIEIEGKKNQRERAKEILSRDFILFL